MISKESPAANDEAKLARAKGSFKEYVTKLSLQFFIQLMRGLVFVSYN